VRTPPSPLPALSKLDDLESVDGGRAESKKLPLFQVVKKL